LREQIARSALARASPFQRLILAIAFSKPPGEFGAREFDTHVERVRAVCFQMKMWPQSERIRGEMMAVAVVHVYAVSRHLHAEVRVADRRCRRRDFFGRIGKRALGVYRHQLVGEAFGQRLKFAGRVHQASGDVAHVLAVDANVRDQIRKDSKGKLRTMGLLGDKVFDITTGTPRYQPLRDGDTVTVVPSIDYEAVIAQASGAVNDMVALTKDLRAITGGLVKGQGTLGQMLTNRALYDQLNGTLSRANTMLARFQNPNGTVGRMLDDPLLYERLVSVVSSTDSLIVSINATKGTAGLLLRDTTLYTNLVGITRGADSLMRQLTNGQGTASRLLTDQTLYDQLNKLVTDLSAVVADVRRDPGRYTKGMVKVF